ncbi:MAG: hypothetical protein AB7S26_28590 [Sandaracinaceae bacterium]
MERASAALIGVATVGLLLSCGGADPKAPTPEWAALLPEQMPIEGELTVNPDEREHPALELRFPWANAQASLGWGGVHLWARPASDNVTVTALIDAPASRARWSTCNTAVLDLDGRRVPFRAEYVGRPMGSSGSYEAVQIDLDVLTLRKIARGRVLSGHICGDPFTVTEDQRAAISRFVDWFDRIAVPRQHGDAPFYREVGPRPRELPCEVSPDEEPLAG